MAEGVSSLSSLSCPICFEVYQSNKTPKVLHCGHTFCFQCLGKMVLANYRFAYIQCPTCRTEICLPPSGKAEGFQTNFALMNLVSELDANNQNKTKTVQAPPGVIREDTAGLKCPQHKKPMEFYCETCKIQVCHKCLLADHKVGQHGIVSAADVAENLSNQLQTLTEKLQYYEQEKQALGDTICKAIHNCRQDNVTLQDVIQRTLQREIHKLEEAASMMLTQIAEKAEVQECVYTNLQQQHSNINTLHYQIKGKCRTLEQNFQQVDLSQSAELAQIDRNIDTLKNHIDSLKATCQSTPANIGLTISPSQCELGITLNQVTPKPMILQASVVPNGNNSPHSNKTGGQLRRAVLLPGAITNLPSDCFPLQQFQTKT